MSSQPLLSSSVPRKQRRLARACGRAALERILRIHERLGNVQQFTAESIAHEFEVSPRTIKRDIEFMRDRLGVSITCGADWLADLRAVHSAAPLKSSSAVAASWKVAASPCARR
jgi:DeoR/GlpR family transcriptional regulator of sugar metabolism